MNDYFTCNILSIYDTPINFQHFCSLFHMPPATVDVEIAVRGLANALTCVVTLLDPSGQSGSQQVAQATIDLRQTTKATLNLNDVKLWWPYLMKEQFGFLYEMKVSIFARTDMFLVKSYDGLGVLFCQTQSTSFKLE